MNRELLKNHPLKHAAEEFYLANCAYRKMVEIGVGSFVEYEKAWREFLCRIEKVWTKTQSAVCKMSNWKKIESSVINMRKKDPLLKYLHHARNVEEHSIADIVADWDAMFKVKQEGHILRMSCKAWDRPLLSVKNRGIICEPPKEHLGKSIEHLKGKGKAEPRVIAELALIFYCDLLDRVSVEVVGNIGDGGNL